MSDNDYVKPPKRQDDDYVAPPRKQDDGYVAPPKRFEESTTVKYENLNQSSNPSKTQHNAQTADPYTNPRYFGTPKVGLKFYLTGYVMLSLLLLYMEQDLGFIGKMVAAGYVLLSNYTYSWFADYQRYKNGFFSWFFTPYGSVKAGWGSSWFSNYQKGTVTRGFFGGETVSSRTNYKAHFLHIVIVALILELIKYVITVPLAFVSVLLHKQTIRKYNALVDQHMG